VHSPWGRRMDFEKSAAAFFDELEKISDIIISSRKDPNAPVVSGGIFIGADPKDVQKARQRIMHHLRTKGSIRKAREAYAKEFPHHYTTTAFKREAAPGGIRHGLGKLFRTKASKSREKSYKERVKDPRIFVRVAPAGSAQQRFFYKEVARGLYDKELNQPHVPKKQRVVYI